MNRFFKMCVLIATIIIIDQITKGIVQQKFFLGESVPVVKDFFHLTYVRNPGAAFGMGANSPSIIRIPFFFILPIVACFGLIYAVWVTRNKSFWNCLSYSLILAGAAGNLIDRISMNYVVDFFDFFIGTHHFAAFNVADSSITIAAIILIIEVLFFSKKKENSAAGTI